MNDIYHTTAVFPVITHDVCFTFNYINIFRFNSVRHIQRYGPNQIAIKVVNAYFCLVSVLRGPYKVDIFIVAINSLGKASRCLYDTDFTRFRSPSHISRVSPAHSPEAYMSLPSLYAMAKKGLGRSAVSIISKVSDQPRNICNNDHGGLTVRYKKHFLL